MTKFIKRKKITPIDNGNQLEESMVANGPGYQKMSYKFVQKRAFSKRRDDDDDDDERGMGTLAKLGIALGTTALASYGAYKGVFGSGAQRFVGGSLKRIGGSIGNERLVRSGANAEATGLVNSHRSKFKGNTVALDDFEKTKAQKIKDLGNRFANRAFEKYNMDVQKPNNVSASEPATNN